MLRPRKDVAERKLARVLDHIERHPHDDYAKTNRDRLAERFANGTSASADRVNRDERRHVQLINRQGTLAQRLMDLTTPAMLQEAAEYAKEVRCANA